MRSALFTTLLILATIFTLNGVAAENIAHGVKVVVIDAGHGGRFPGAHYAGIVEKDLTLRVALELGRMIEEQMPGVKVVYTRKTDTALAETLAADLQRRADIANKAGGDLFVSIHVNAARSISARGVETLIMGESPKEQRYNEDALFANNREDLIDMSDEKTAAIVRAYIQNLQFTYGEYSMAMARCIQQQYVKSGRVDRGVKPQLLRVLYTTDMPGVLTEIGFMSNAEEAAFMKSERGFQEICQNLFNAVKSYANFVKGTREGDDPKVNTPAEATAKSESELTSEVPVTKPEKPIVKLESKSESEMPTKKIDSKSKTSEMNGEKSVAVSESKPTTQKPAVTSESKNKKVVERGYTIQLLASPEPVSPGSTRFKGYKNQVKEYLADGRFCYKYCIGLHADRNQAQRMLLEVRRSFPDAFVVSCENGRIVK